MSILNVLKRKIWVDSESEVIEKDQSCEISFRWFVFPLCFQGLCWETSTSFECIISIPFWCHLSWPEKGLHNLPHLFCLYFYHNLTPLSPNPQSNFPFQTPDWDPSFFHFLNISHQSTLTQFCINTKISLLSSFLFCYFTPLKFIKHRSPQPTQI